MEDNVKQFIRSLLTSAPVAVQMFQLEKDYRNTIGEPIPYHKLGYNSLEHFLRSIPETVLVRGTGREAEVVPVITEKSAHINEMVAKQKVSTKGRRGRPLPRRFLLQPTPVASKKILYPNRLAESSKPNDVKPEPQSFQTTSTRNSTKSNNDKHVNKDESLNNNNKPFEPIKISNLEKEIIEATKKAKNEENNTSNENSASLTSNARMLREKICAVKQSRLPDYGRAAKNRSGSETNAAVFQFGVTKKGNDNDSSKENLDLSVMNSSSVPPYIQKNLLKLMGRHPDGVWCAELPLIYKRMFHAELNYQEYGFRSLIELCTSLTSVFHYARPSTEDFRLYDGSKPLPQNAAKKFTIASYSPDEDSDNNALPAVDWDDVLNFLPKDIFQPGSDIPRVFVPETTKEYDSFGIVPGEIYDISKFWVFLDNGVLDGLMDEMQDFYRVHQTEYSIPRHLIREGIYCVQIIFGEYHRALIIDVLPDIEDMIRVLYIDYGTVTRASIKGLCFLHEQFAQVPAQALRCRLANVVPPLEGAPWSKQSTKCFKELVTDRILKATVIKVNWEDQFLDIFLLDLTNPDKTFYINDKLVEEGHAQYPDKERKKYKIDSEHKCKVKQIHLFPTFAELEHGLAPSTGEMAVYDECGVPIYFAYPQYFDIDTTSEKLRVKTTDHWYQQIHRHRREVQIYHYDITKIRSKPLNLGYLGPLAEEIVKLIEDENLNKSLQMYAFQPSNQQQTENLEYKDVDHISNQFQMLEFAEKLKKDCLLAQDIMSDLEKFCNTQTSDSLKKEFEIGSAQDFWSLNDGAENVSFTSSEENFSKDDAYMKTQIPSTNNLNFSLDFEDDYLNFPSRQSEPAYDEGHCLNQETQIVSSKDKSEVVTRENSMDRARSTNPFLDYCDDIDFEESSALKDLVFNPTNPFLTYRSEKLSDESNNSTVYGSVIQEVNIQSWSTEDNRTTSGEIESSNSSSVGSLYTSSMDTCSIGTQTILEEIKIDDELSEKEQSSSKVEVQAQSALSTPVPYSYPQNWVAPNDNYYGFTGYPPTMYHHSHSYIPPMYPGSMYPFRQQYPAQSHYPTGIPFNTGYHRPIPPSAPPHFSSQSVTTTTVGPPPGFLPNSNIYQVSRVLQTTVSANVVADGSGAIDFYDLYNAKLKLELESASSDASL